MPQFCRYHSTVRFALWAVDPQANKTLRFPESIRERLPPGERQGKGFQVQQTIDEALELLTA
jgi:hypothetical protein